MTSNDKELGARIKRDDKEAFQKLFEKYAPRIFNFSLSYFKNKNEAEELVQIVFIKIWENRTNISSTHSLKPYIFKIAVNTIYDFIRQKNIKHAFEDYALKNYTTSDDNTWHKVVFDEMKQRLDYLISQLPEMQQKIFQLNKLDGLSNDEIADNLNISKRTVENHLYRALVFLKKNFKDKSFITLLFFSLYCG